jgi:YegS/Rv2252/BmrU family lipid kinase
MKEIFLINKSAYEKKSEVRSVFEILSKRNKVLLTESREDAYELANYYGNKVDVIYAVGGDGTVNSILQGLVGKEAALGIVPLGTGNDFFRTIKDQEGYQTIDVGRINDYYFLNEASIGLDAETCYKKVQYEEKIKNPKTVYYLSLLKAFLEYNNKELSINGEDYKDYSILAICNGQYYGGGFNVAPHAILDDGYFDVISTDLTKAQMILHIGGLKKGEHVKSPVFSEQRHDAMHIKAKEPVVCNFDGEILIDDEFQVTNEHNAIKVFNNPNIVRRLIKK